MGTNQGDRQASVRGQTGTALTYEGDWHALFTLSGIPAGDFNGRFLAFINFKLGTSYSELNGAMYALAVSQGAKSWNELGTITFSVPGTFIGRTQGRATLTGGLTNSLKGSVSAGAVLAGGLTLKRALAGAVQGGATLGANLSGGAGTLRGSIPSNTVLMARLTNSLKGAVGAGATLSGALSLKRALAGNVPGGATFTSALTGVSSAKLVTHGDSITSTSQPSSDPTQYYGAVLNSLISSRQGTSYTLVRQGIGGQSWNYVWPSSGSPNTLIQDAVINIDPHVGTNNILVAYAGTNGIQLGGHSAATEAADADTYMAARIAAGWTPANIYMVSLLPRETMSAKTRNTFNRALQAYCATRGCKFVAIHELYDLGRNSPSDTTLFYDQIHPTVYGHSLIAETIYDKIYSATWTPTQIATLSGVSLAMWFDAQDATTMFSDAGVTQATNGQAIQQWNDKSGNGRHVSQATSGNRPTLSTMFSKAAVNFDGSNDFLTNTALSSFPTTIHVGAAWGPANGNISLFSCSTDGVNGDSAVALDQGANGVEHIGANTVWGPTGSTSLKMQTLTFGQGAYQTFNGGQTYGALGTGASPGPITAIRVGQGHGSGMQMNGPMGELIFFTGQLRSVDQRRLNEYLTSRWGMDGYADDFAFTDLTGQTASTVVTSNTVTVSGLGANNQARFMYQDDLGYGVTPQYSLNGGAWTNATFSGICVSNGDTIQLRMTSRSGSLSTAVVRIDLGKDQYFWSVTTA